MKLPPAFKIEKHISAALAFILCCGAVILALVNSAPATEAAADGITDATIQKMEDQLAALEAEQNTYLSQLSATRTKKDAEMEYKSYLDAYLSSTETKITLAEDLSVQLSAQIETKTQEIIDKQAEYDEQYALCLERLQYSYEEGDIGYLELLLDAGSLSEFLVQVERVSSILEYDKNMLDRLEAERVDLESVKAALEVSYATQEKLLADLAADKTDYEEKAQESKDYIDSLSADESASLTLYYAAKAKEEELDRELTAYIKELQAKLAKQYVGGEFIWPLDPSIKRLSSDFGYRTYNGVYENHGALDIPAASGTPIYASNAGTVLKAEYHYSYGNYILIDHGGGKSTLYAHCSALLVSAGDDVVQGQTIAKVGTTGYSGGNHLHFEFRVDGVRDDPKKYVTMPDGWYLG